MSQERVSGFPEKGAALLLLNDSNKIRGTYNLLI